MRIHFDSNQAYQREAVQAVVKVFEKDDYKYNLSSAAGKAAVLSSKNDEMVFEEGCVKNYLPISDEEILKNVQAIQKNNDLSVSHVLEGRHFSIEMETGTGKTYVYLRTVYELNKNYGLKKFVIVVPSIAIREGVLKNLEITKEHFQNLYDNIPVYFEVYDSKKVSGLRNFATSNTVQILVINIDSFAKDENIINRANDKLNGKTPIEFIQKTKPVLILDEPQNMETPKRKKAVESLNYFCALRYSATHLKRYNLLYNLNPVKAYDKGLVKQIEVDSVLSQDNFNEAFISLDKITPAKKSISARIKIDVNSKQGVKRKPVTVKPGDDLYKKSGARELYKNSYIINDVNLTDGYISLANGKKIYIGESIGGLTDEIKQTQILETVKEHFSKEKRLKDKGIKVISLFFIDKVVNYRSYDDQGRAVKGKFAQWFEEAYQEVSQDSKFEGVIPFGAEEVHNGYFSQDKKGKWKDTKGQSQADQDTFSLIMKDKEKLLDINRPLRFIFSHSALREGWDNPNVFQICTLNETRSEMKKRQEIGRGLRLAVNQEGIRTHSKSDNILTVIANESYEDFAKQLQDEIEDDCGVSFEGRTKNKRDRKTVTYRKGFKLDENFKKIWDKIKRRARYKVEYDSNELIKKVVKKIQDMEEIQKTAIKSEKVALEIHKKEGVSAGAIKSSSVNYMDKSFKIPDILLHIEQRTGLTRATIIKILQKSDRLQDALINPQLFLNRVTETIKKLMLRARFLQCGRKNYKLNLSQHSGEIL